MKIVLLLLAITGAVAANERVTPFLRGHLVKDLGRPRWRDNDYDVYKGSTVADAKDEARTARAPPLYVPRRTPQISCSSP